MAVPETTVNEDCGVERSQNDVRRTRKTPHVEIRTIPEPPHEIAYSSLSACVTRSDGAHDCATQGCTFRIRSSLR